MADKKTYTWFEIAEHNTEKSCWLVMDGKVYDVTDYLDAHPGSRVPLLKYAGEDCTKQFEGVNHSQEARRIRESKLIGTVDTCQAPCSEYWLKVRSGKQNILKYTAEDVAKHNKEGDLWVIIGDSVYDFSTLKHPGGQDVINSFAGKDGTEKFNKVDHHKKSAHQTKERFRIGKFNKASAEQPKGSCCGGNCIATGVLTVGVLSLVGYLVYKSYKK